MKKIKISNDLYNRILNWNSDLWRLENYWLCGKKKSKEELFTEAKKLLHDVIEEQD